MHLRYTRTGDQRADKSICFLRGFSIFNGTYGQSSTRVRQCQVLPNTQYRQCAGRAGRRGFDLLGRVIFYGIPLDRIYRILLSRLPRLTGTFPLSSTMVLRLFNLLEGSNYAPYTVDAIRSILRLPHISFGSDVGKSQLLHHLRFSIDYLRRAHLLNQVGKPINLFGIAAHLYYTEPGNLAITALLQSGVIHDICSQPDTIQAERDLVALLCHLFGRRYLPQVYASASNVRDLIQKGPSRVVLPPLHAEARAFLIGHQKETLGIFGAYALAFSSQHADELGPDDRLPLSGIPSDPLTCRRARRRPCSPTSPRQPYDRKRVHCSSLCRATAIPLAALESSCAPCGAGSTSTSTRSQPSRTSSIPSYPSTPTCTTSSCTARSTRS
jgi:hypothetical protein